MAELIIKTRDAFNVDPVKDREGCYKRGDIIDILEDGKTDGMPWLTVLKVVGASVSSMMVLKELDMKEAILLRDFSVHERSNNSETEIKRILDDLRTVTINHRQRTLILGDFLEKPEIVESEVLNTETHLKRYQLRGNALIARTRRRFRIPEELMILWFSVRTVKTMTKPEFDIFFREFIDKSYDDSRVRDTPWGRV